jgi:ADP-ribosylglycohydrolase
MFNSIKKFNQEASEQKRIVNFDIIVDEMTEDVKYDLEMRYESDMFLLNIDNKTEGDIIFNLVMMKSIFSCKKYTEEWFRDRISDKIISIIIFLHLPYSDYIRNYTRNLFRLILVNLDIVNLIIVRNAIEESYVKNPFINDISADSEKIIEFSAFLSELFSRNDKHFEEYENNNPFFKSKYKKKVENISGSLIGKAVGNSIGLLVDGQNTDVCCEYIDIVIKKITNLYGIDKDLGKSGKPRYCLIDGNEKTILFAYGQYTEDTQYTREMLLSIEEGNLNIESFKRKLISLYGGVSLQQDIGVCMRSAPLGAVYMGRKDLCKSISELHCSVANNCTTARACSVLIAETTRLAIENKIKPYARYNLLTNSSIFCRQLVLSIMSIEPTLEKYILTIPDLIAARKKFIKESELEYTSASILADKQIIKIITTECAKSFGEKLSNGGETISTSPVQTTIFCIYCFLCIPDFYISAICMSIRAGGNTKTTASIVGGIVGARLGIESISSYFIDKINDQGKYKSDELIQLCQKLYDQHFTNGITQQFPQLPVFGTHQSSNQQSLFETPQLSVFGTQSSNQQSLFGTDQHSQPSVFGTPQHSTQLSPQPSLFGTSQSSNKQSLFGTTHVSPQQSIFGDPQKSTFKTPEITLSASMFVKPPPFLSRTTNK